MSALELKSENLETIEYVCEQIAYLFQIEDYELAKELLNSKEITAEKLSLFLDNCPNEKVHDLFDALESHGLGIESK